jgi:hypothetical protein
MKWYFFPFLSFSICLVVVVLLMSYHVRNDITPSLTFPLDVMMASTIGFAVILNSYLGVPPAIATILMILVCFIHLMSLSQFYGDVIRR